MRTKGIAATVFVALALPLWPAHPRADECGPKRPIVVTAVCGRTVFGVGWLMPEPAWSLARIWPELPLELTDRRGTMIARTKSDGQGRFEFRGVRKGSYVLQTAEGSGLAVFQPLTVTVSNAVCSRNIYAYVAESGWPCRNWATAIEPISLQVIEPDAPPSDRIVPPRNETREEKCAVDATAPASATRYASVTVGEAGTVTVVTQDCRRLAFEDTPRLLENHPYRVAAKSAVSADHSTAGWLALFKECESCSSSDVLPLELVLVQDGAMHRITSENGEPIWYWMFQAGGKQVALMAGPRLETETETLHYELWDVAAGKQLARYAYKYGPDGRRVGPKPPKWAPDLDAAEREDH